MGPYANQPGWLDQSESGLVQKQAHEFKRQIDSKWSNCFTTLEPKTWTSRLPYESRPGWWLHALKSKSLDWRKIIALVFTLAMLFMKFMQICNPQWREGASRSESVASTFKIPKYVQLIALDWTDNLLSRFSTKILTPVCKWHKKIGCKLSSSALRDGRRGRLCFYRLPGNVDYIVFRFTARWLRDDVNKAFWVLEQTGTLLSHSGLMVLWILCYSTSNLIALSALLWTSGKAD